MDSDIDVTPDLGRQRALIVARLQYLLVIIGLLVSGYLSYLKIADSAAVCVESGPFNCNVVLNSQYSEISGVPIAYLGFAVYAFIGLLLLLQRPSEFLRQYGNMIVFGIGLFAWLFSMWLVYVQFVLLQALCPWCLDARNQFHHSVSDDRLPRLS